ncbi:acyltransferase [Myxococcota bacterium]|nr:acyltransferase [Myxococcota bacterium]
MAKPETPRSENHLLALDGLRFLAAAVVLLGHCFNVIALPADFEKLVRSGPLTVFINGYGAVHLFFILSGFVLAGSAGRIGQLTDLAQFYTRRILRIHPPYVYALLLAWAMSFLYDTTQNHGAVTSYLIQRAAVHLSFAELAPYFLYPSYAEYQLGPAWTLTIEMHYSFLLPLMLWVTHRSHWSVIVGLSLFVLLGTTELWNPLDYALFFALGVAIHQERTRLADWARRLPWGAGPLAVGLGLFTFAAPWLFDLVFEPGFVYAPSGFIVSALGGSILLCTALYCPPVERLLSRPLLAYGGRISYSFYLLHYPIMILCSRTLTAPLSAFDAVAYVASVFLLTFGAAAVSYPLIERPAIRLGNRLCRMIAKRGSATAQLSRLAT